MFKHETRLVARERLVGIARGLESVQGASGEEGEEEDGGRQGGGMEGETQTESRGRQCWSLEDREKGGCGSKKGRRRDVGWIACRFVFVLEICTFNLSDIFSNTSECGGSHGGLPVFIWRRGGEITRGQNNIMMMDMLIRFFMSDNDKFLYFSITHFK